MSSIFRATLLAACVAISSHAWAAKEPGTQWTPKSDSKMLAAGREAQATLPVFWRVFDRQPADVSEYAVKVAFTTAHGGEEHLWLALLSRDGGQVRGVVANEPEDVPGIHVGARVSAPVSRISDWSYSKRNRRYGNYTTRVMLTRAPPNEAAVFGADLSPQPLEPGAR